MIVLNRPFKSTMIRLIDHDSFKSTIWIDHLNRPSSFFDPVSFCCCCFLDTYQAFEGLANIMAADASSLLQLYKMNSAHNSTMFALFSEGTNNHFFGRKLTINFFWNQSFFWNNYCWLIFLKQTFFFGNSHAENAAQNRRPHAPARGLGRHVFVAVVDDALQQIFSIGNHRSHLGSVSFIIFHLFFQYFCPI